MYFKKNLAILRSWSLQDTLGMYNLFAKSECTIHSDLANKLYSLPLTGCKLKAQEYN